MLNEETKQRFDAWWRGEKTDRPMMRLIKARTQPDKSKLIDLQPYYKSEKDLHIGPELRVAATRNLDVTHEFLFEAFNYVDINMGPGSMAAYLAADPEYSRDTVWYHKIETESVRDFENLSFKKSTKYWEEHLAAVRRAVELAGEDYFVCIPDIIENLDVLASLRGSEELCFDLMDDPEGVKRCIQMVDDNYFSYYDAMYDIVKRKNGECCYTAFSIWGRDKVAKLQCDFSCLMSAESFEELVIPSLKKQCDKIPYTLYHLDGKDAIRHVPALMKLDKLNALNWTFGAGQPDAADERWFKIYDQVMDAGKSLWLSFCDGTVEQWAGNAKKVADRYGNKGLYFHFPVVDEKGAEIVEKTFCSGKHLFYSEER